jgi:hypothetical protein
MAAKVMKNAIDVPNKILSMKNRLKA